MARVTHLPACRLQGTRGTSNFREAGSGSNLAAELLGHTDPRVTIQHYIRRNEHVNPLTGELLDGGLEAEPGHAAGILYSRGIDVQDFLRRRWSHGIDQRRADR